MEEGTRSHLVFLRSIVNKKINDASRADGKRRTRGKVRGKTAIEIVTDDFNRYWDLRKKSPEAIDNLREKIRKTLKDKTGNAAETRAKDTLEKMEKKISKKRQSTEETESTEDLTNSGVDRTPHAVGCILYRKVRKEENAFLIQELAARGVEVSATIGYRAIVSKLKECEQTTDKGFFPLTSHYRSYINK